MLARRREAPSFLRHVPYGLTAATVYYNWSSGTHVEGKVAHVVMVMLWIVVSETGIHVAKLRMGQEAGIRLDPIPMSRWFLSPIRTPKLYRRMVLWNVTSYAKALTYEKARLYGLALARSHFGGRRFAWRFKVPALVRMELAGELPYEVTSIIDRNAESQVSGGPVYDWKAPMRAWFFSQVNAPQVTRATDLEVNAQVTPALTQVTDPGHSESDLEVTRATDLEVTSATDSGHPGSALQVTPQVTPQVTLPLTQVTDPGHPENTRQVTLRPASTSLVKAARRPRQVTPPAKMTNTELVPVVRKMNDQHRIENNGKNIPVLQLANKLSIGRDRARLLLNDAMEEPALRLVNE